MAGDVKFQFDSRWYGPYGDQWANKLGSSFRDMTAAWKRVATEVLEPEVQAQFSSQGSRFGTPWAPLAPGTIKRRGGDSGHILEDTGRLRDSFTSGGADHIEEITQLGLNWGSSVYYGEFLDKGTSGRHGSGRSKIRTQRARSIRSSGRGAQVSRESTGAGMPARPILSMTPAIEDGISGIMREYAASSAEDVGLQVGGGAGFSRLKYRRRVG